MQAHSPLRHVKPHQQEHGFTSLLKIYWLEHTASYAFYCRTAPPRGYARVALALYIHAHTIHVNARIHAQILIPNEVSSLSAVVTANAQRLYLV
jgi:hypothetical protein